MLIALALLLAAPASPGEDKPDLSVVHRIKDEAFRNGQVMDHLFWLTDANGPRLTGSPGFAKAAAWVVKRLAGLGATQPHEEKWGPFGRGWSMSKFSASLVEPDYAPLLAVPKAWSGATRGAVRGEPVLAPLFLRTEKDERRDLAKVAAHIQRFIEANKGKLRGKVVLLDQVRDLEQPKEPESTRLDEAKLKMSAEAPEPIAPLPWTWPLQAIPADPKERQALFAWLPLEVSADFWERSRRAYFPLWSFLRDEGALAVFTADDRGDGGIVFAESAGGWEADAPAPPPVLAVAPESYDRVARLVQKGVPAKVEVELAAAFTEPGDGVNVVAELPGKSKKDEVVMMGAHLDSWHGGTGATDNAAGSAVMIEAFRILKALNLPMERTVRIALWSGEEQGLFGSRGYVREHFGDPVTMKLKPEHAKLAAYFNLDNGGGKIRGVWLQGNDMARPIFEQWLMPFKDEGAATLSIRNTGGTDHLSFDAVGLPGFQFIQDPLDYSTRTHHSHIDDYEHVNPGDLMQAAAIVASFVYDAANRKEMLPRKPLPPPLPAKGTAVSTR